ncbi:DNA repair protein RecO [Alistipes sp. ZOR0009]|uniref:DNA repair protein RecO n=1 Tax=Alistipes sp. ZOR0009 TaxID=1339253 RepID=UPI0006486017|nr:DNA repair protein RecO [Alistipes sp. ZOR0009]
MEHKVKGIILNTFPFKETSLICHIYTNEFGRKSYLINGVRKEKSRGKSAILQPLFLLDMNVYQNNKAEIQKVKEFRLSYPYQSIPFNPIKSSLAFFISELLYKILREEHPNRELFAYLEQAFLALDVMEEGVYNFHLYLMVQLTKYLGLQPTLLVEGTPSFFDLKTGHFTPIEPKHPFYMKRHLSRCFEQLYYSSLLELSRIKMSRDERREFIGKMLEFYSHHFGGTIEIKSLAVVHELFD